MKALCVLQDAKSSWTCIFSVPQLACRNAINFWVRTGRLGWVIWCFLLLFLCFRKRRNSQSKAPSGGKKKHVQAEEEGSGSEEAEEETPESSLQLALASGTTQRLVNIPSSS